MKIFFATHNPGKVREFKKILDGIADVEQINLEYDEIQSDNPEEVAKDAAKKLAEKYGKPIVVEDSGLFIDSLNGFPGVHSAPIHKQIGLKGILKLMEGVSDRGCEYRSAVGYCESGKKAVTFLGTEKGTISREARGTHGFGHDSIFMPEGSGKTYGETANVEDAKKFRRKAVEKLVEWLKEKGC
ncbi:RdgB/HAM1 family non-canonical purine NTP pyrophosphatase [Candidatus Woesearchaeota archaeon]|nr:RdgB/HAM1 family non-canonical purine NTP pyrophosphatase [Candidatus Woesearchaeota archaeon]